MANESKPDTTRDVAIRSACIDMAIRSGCGQYYDDDGKMLFDDQIIVNAASKFEDFIKGKSSYDPSFVNDAAKINKKEW